MNSPAVTFGGRLRAARTDRTMTLRELSEASGISQKSISNLERGKAKPRPQSVGKLATALGVQAHELNPPGQDDLEDMARLAEYHLLVVRCCGGRPVVEGRVCAHCNSNDPARNCSWAGVDLDAKVRIAK